MLTELDAWLLDGPNRTVHYSHDGRQYRVGLIDGELPDAPEVAVGRGEDDLEAECAAADLVARAEADTIPPADTVRDPLVDDYEPLFSAERDTRESEVQL